MVRFVHVSDTHLGYQAYGRLSPEGLNQREVDLQDAFARVVDWCVAERPDLVIHSGDLFDSPRPSNRAIAFALEQVRRLADARIPTLLLSGNHDAPRLRETGHIFRVFEGVPHVRPVYRGGLETIRWEAGGTDLLVHAVPQAVTQEAFQADLASLAPERGLLNVLVVHGTVAGVDGLFTNELNELLIPQTALDPGFDYVALGHFHGHRRVAPNAYYAGSTERTSIHEWDQEKTFSLVEVDKGQLRLTTHPTGARTMRDVGPLPAWGLDPAALTERAVEAVSEAAEPGGILRLVLRDVDRAALKALDLDALHAAAEPLLHFVFHPVLKEESVDAQLPSSLGHLEDELAAFLDHYPLEGLDREAVRSEALRLLGQAREAPDAA